MKGSNGMRGPGALAFMAAAALLGAEKPKNLQPIHPTRITGDNAVKMQIRRQGGAKVKESRYDGETLRRLRAERGCGRPPKAPA